MFYRIEADEKNLREQIEYPDITFPFYVWLDIYNLFIDHTVNSHWHYDFEFGYVVSGQIDYYINDTLIKLRKGDCVFVNSNNLHMSSQSAGCDDAAMFTVTFPATLLTTDVNSTIYKKYLQPIIEKLLEGFKVAPDNPIGQQMAKLMKEMFMITFRESYLKSNTISTNFNNYLQSLGITKTADGLKINPDTFCGPQILMFLEEMMNTDLSYYSYEPECLTRVIQIMIFTLRHVEKGGGDLLWHRGSAQLTARAKEILTYIHSHYHEKFTIADIANYVGISRSECFRCFKHYINKRPVEYINKYRLTKVAKQLKETEKSIAEILAECGFENASYFGKIFKETYQMTPLQFRNKHSS